MAQLREQEAERAKADAERAAREQADSDARVDRATNEAARINQALDSARRQANANNGGMWDVNKLELVVRNEQKPGGPLAELSDTDLNRLADMLTPRFMALLQQAGLGSAFR